MKLRFKLAGIEVQGVKIENIEVSTEYSLQEITGEYALVKQIIKELPEVMTDLKAGFVKFTEIDNELKEAENEARRTFETQMEVERTKQAEEKDAAFQRVLREVREVAEENNLREEREV